MQHYRCAQCPAIFSSISSRKNHVRHEHQSTVHTKDIHGSEVIIERVNNRFSCPQVACSYSTVKASLMQTHYHNCRSKIRTSVPSVASHIPRVVVQSRVIPAGSQVQELAGWMEFGVYYHKLAKLLLCSNDGCHVCVKVEEISSHLQTQHHIKCIVEESMLDDIVQAPPQDIYNLEQPIAPFRGVRMYMGFSSKMEAGEIILASLGFRLFCGTNIVDFSMFFRLIRTTILSQTQTPLPVSLPVARPVAFWPSFHPLSA
ncbi:hypothetical protein PGTUg99_008255 [Puccinia graminis f. sp. tritici]|uniref:C2H2-type domain-containing protein n=1 Tax=Puccinia graminis f. sp. tritici TaxID=56615 RepID=A0A5B0PTH8_PUCGR|nr:hypothetical protein PGTUg99_003145 [Puccinia graminis f. sp. tritici]KAA1111385.1 hypothetical protein PGTUg99_008255 [Puccinia graminis f. sp. tritici]